MWHVTRDRYPECPERTRAIWAAMTEAGLVGGAGVVVLGRGRLLAREECGLVHGDQFWDTWVTSEDMEPRRGDSAVSRAGLVRFSVIVNTTRTCVSSSTMQLCSAQ